MKISTFLHSVVLLIILVGGLSAFYYVRPNTALQFVVGVLTSVAYAAWGIIHHAMQKDLHINVVVEYALMAAIAIIVLSTVLLD